MRQGEGSQSSHPGQELTTTFAAFQGPVLHTGRFKCCWCLYWAHFFPQIPHAKLGFHPPYPTEFTSRPWTVVSYPSDFSHITHSSALARIILQRLAHPSHGYALQVHVLGLGVYTDCLCIACSLPGWECLLGHLWSCELWCSGLTWFLLKSPGFGRGLEAPVHPRYWRGVVCRCGFWLQADILSNFSSSVISEHWLFIFSAYFYLPSQGDVYTYFVVLALGKTRGSILIDSKSLILEHLMNFHRA